jgi:hypothetical protein
MGAAWQILNKAESGKRKSGKQTTGAQRFPLSALPLFRFSGFVTESSPFRNLFFAR